MNYGNVAETFKTVLLFFFSSTFQSTWLWLMINLAETNFGESHVLTETALRAVPMFLFKELSYLAFSQNIHNCQKHSGRMAPLTCKCLVVTEKWELPECIVEWQEGIKKKNMSESWDVHEWFWHSKNTCSFFFFPAGLLYCSLMTAV